MGAIPYTRRRGKAGTFYFKRRAPGDVLDALRATVWRDSPTRTHWDISLKTRDWHEAFKLAAQRVEETDALISKVRERLQASSNAKVQEAEEAVRRAQRLAEAEGRVASLSKEDQAHVASAGGIAALAADALDNLTWSNMTENVVDMTERYSPEHDLTHAEQLAADVELATDRAAASHIKSIVATQARILTKIGLDVDARLADFAETEPGLGDILKHYAKTRGFPGQTQRQYAYAVRRFTELHGDIPARNVTREQFRVFADEIRRLPAGRKDGVQDLPFRAAIERADALELARITDATRYKHLTAIRTIMSHAATVGYIESNPLDGFRLAKARQQAHKASKGKRDPFDAMDLQRIETALQSAYKLADDDFWPPMVAKWQGMRLEEICQLRRSDIDVSAQTISITDEGEEQKVKNAASVRVIPIHPALIALGFLDHVARSRGPMLFTSFQPDQRGRYGGPYGKRFSRLLREKVGITDTRKTFHSYRHTWTDAARAAGIEDGVRWALAGREISTNRVENAYGSGYPVATLREAIAKIRY